MNEAPRLRVLQVLDAFGTGGAETWLIELLRLWSLEGRHQMDFLATGGLPARFDEEALSLGARMYYVKYGRRTLASFSRQFRNLLVRGRYDAIHDHADYASGWHYLIGAGVLPRVRVTHVHNPRLYIDANYAVNRSRKIATSMGKLLVRRLATNVCGTSSEVLRDYGFPVGALGGEPRSVVVHCGIDVRKFSAPRASARTVIRGEFGWSHDTKIILFAGRLDSALDANHPRNHKNSWFALNIARIALAKDPKVRLIMAGGGHARLDLDHTVKEWGHAAELKITGVRSDIPELMRAADVLLFPSTQEGLGMVAVEAQAAGLPVLASTAVPLEARVIHELFHQLPLSASEYAWASAALDLMNHPRLSPDICQQALERSSYSIQHSSSILEAIYHGN